MTNPLLELAERCEAASGADRELDAAIAVAVGREPQAREMLQFPAYSCCIPAYTASIDSAMTLVPEGWRGSLPINRPGDYAELWRPGIINSNVFGKGATPALALCSASLKALAEVRG